MPRAEARELRHDVKRRYGVEAVAGIGSAAAETALAGALLSNRHRFDRVPRS